MSTSTARLAVVGSGVSGLVAAYAAARSGAHVTLFEADDRLGGHADTHTVSDGTRDLRIDTGFIVHNRRTYPVLCRLFDELGVATQDSEMSMSIRDDLTGLEWAGARGWQGLFPRIGHAFAPDYLRMLAEIPRFHRRARALLAQDTGADRTLTEFVADHGFSAYFVRHFLEPLVAAVWSCDPSVAGQYPARYLFQFLSHHGMLSVTGSPTWRTVCGGSGTYVAAVAERLDEVLLSTPVAAVLEREDRVSIVDRSGVERDFDQVIIATHPHQALAMLKDPTPAQQDVLAAITYSSNVALLHTDISLLPNAVGARSSWNFRRVRQEASPVTVTYDLTRLQRLPTTTCYLVTLGGEGLVDPGTVIARREYEHPLYTPTSVAAQGRLTEIGTDRIAFAGAYHGWGFHEDGARSGLEAAERLGHTWEPTGSINDAIGAYRTTVWHQRQQPWRRTFRHRSTMWVTDVDQAPSPSGWSRLLHGSVESRDHVGDPALPLRANIATLLTTHGVELGDARVLLAAHPRAWGFCFNPISVWWCVRPDGSVLATVIEVHNTYGGRFAYVVHGAADDAVINKQLYVSPFHEAVGTYRVRAPLPTDRLEVRVDLHSPDGSLFRAGLLGTRCAHPPAWSGLSGLRDALLIRAHGITLWARRLPIQPRPEENR